MKIYTSNMYIYIYINWRWSYEPVITTEVCFTHEKCQVTQGMSPPQKHHLPFPYIGTPAGKSSNKMTIPRRKVEAGHQDIKIWQGFVKKCQLVTNLLSGLNLRLWPQWSAAHHWSLRRAKVGCRTQEGFHVCPLFLRGDFQNSQARRPTFTCKNLRARADEACWDFCFRRDWNRNGLRLLCALGHALWFQCAMCCGRSWIHDVGCPWKIRIYSDPLH